MHTLIPAPSPAVAGHRPLLLAVAVAACFSAPVTLRAQPTGAQAIHGAAALSQQGSKLVVTTTNGAGTNHSAINWQSFSVPAGSTTQFNQPSVASTSINRVLGNNPSAIFGTLSSNGRLVLVNPAGIAVGAGAVVDTAGFTASTLRMTDADALAGRLRFGDGSAAGNLSVGGQILARSGDVVLIAPNVETASSALIQSPNGTTAIAAGQKVEITGRGLEGIKLELQAPANSAVNLGVLTGDAVGIFAGTLKHSGLISATAATVEGGKVVLKSRGDTLVDGRVVATAGPKGGAIDVLGDRVAVYGNAVLDVSGAAGGGVVRVGGDYQGANAAVPNANVTFVGSGASIRADGGTTGDGGRVIVWADDTTRMAGQISARGGSQAGDGGFVEVSGKKGLELTGRADLRAPSGNAGTLLLDPNDITISGPHTSNPAPSPPPPTAAPNYDFSPSDETATSAVATIEDQLALGHVRVMSNVASNGPGGGLITVQDPISWTSSYALALEADSSIAVNANISGPAGALALIAKGAGTITQAPGTGIQVAELILATESGAATLESSTNNVGSLAASVASLSFKNSNSLTIKELTNPFVVGTVIGVTADGHASIKTLAGNITVDAPIAAGSVALDAAGSIVATAEISTWGGDAGNPATGAVKLDAGGGITFTNIRTYGDGGSGSWSIDGGPVTLAAVGNVQGGSIFTSGSNTSYQLGAKGGNVSVTSSNGGIALTGSILATGGSSLSWEGGAGGNVTLDAKNNVSVGDIAIQGGSSGQYYSNNGDRGGNGGIITVTSSLGSVNAGSLGSFGGSSQIHPAGDGGAVTLSGKLGVTVLGVNTYGGAVMDGDYYTAPGGNGGQVTITSSDGAVSTGNVQTFGGDSPSFGGGTGGAVTLSGKLGVTALNIATYGGANTVAEEYLANGGDGGNVTITASSGAISTGNIRTSGGNSVSMGGGNGGAVVVSANGNVSVGNVFTHGGSNLNDNYQDADGGDGGDVSITSTLGSISGSVGVGGGSISSYGGNSYSRDGGHGGSVRMSAEGSILLNAIRTIGGSNATHGSGSGGFGGDVSLSSNSGGISLLAGGGGIRTWGGYGHNALPGDGGAVELFAKATSGPGIAGAIYTPEIDTGGGDAGSYYASGGSAGGRGGSILVEAGTLFAVPLIHAQGGNGGTSTIGAAGGNSGDVNIRQLTGSLDLSGMAIYAHGGAGGYGLTVGGAGGAGGDVRLRGDGGIVSSATTMINATGGQGGDSEGTSAADRGGAGGHGGGISLSAPGAAMTLAGSLGAVGGAGGLISDDSSSTGGNGGAGGSISISGGTMSLANELAINVGGGLAGHAQEVRP